MILTPLSHANEQFLKLITNKNDPVAMVVMLYTYDLVLKIHNDILQ